MHMTLAPWAVFVGIVLVGYVAWVRYYNRHIEPTLPATRVSLQEEESCSDSVGEHHV